MGAAVAPSSSAGHVAHDIIKTLDKRLHLQALSPPRAAAAVGAWEKLNHFAVLRGLAVIGSIALALGYSRVAPIIHAMLITCR